MVDVAQSVRVTDCGSEGRGFESHLPPLLKRKAFGYAERFFSCGIFADRGSPTAAGQNELCELQSAARGGGELRGSLNRNNSRVEVRAFTSAIIYFNVSDSERSDLSPLRGGVCETKFRFCCGGSAIRASAIALTCRTHFRGGSDL